MRGIAAVTVVGYHVGHHFDDLPGTAGLTPFAAPMLTTVVSILRVTPFAYLSRRFFEAPLVALGRRLGASSATALAIRKSG
jgi:peptidoglycan/LPS O-acetylase OafA/YrhL